MYMWHIVVHLNWLNAADRSDVRHDVASTSTPALMRSRVATTSTTRSIASISSKLKACHSTAAAGGGGVVHTFKHVGAWHVTHTHSL